jgi:hypothetical protein
MAAKNAKGKVKTILKAALPFLALLIALIFVYFLWRFYQPRRTMNFHHGNVSQLRHNPAPAITA